MRRIHRNPAAALVVAVVALVAALQGPALAQDAYSSASKLISGSKIKKGSITGKQVKRDSLTGRQIKESTLGTVKNATNATNAQNAANAQSAANAQNAAKAAQADKATSADSANVANAVSGVTRVRKFVTATSGATADAARTAAPEVPLVTAGALTLYGKCYSTATQVYADIYIKTSADRAVLDSEFDSLDGGDAASAFLNTDTLETDRQVYGDSVSTDKSADIYNYDYGQWTAVAPDGTTVRGDNIAGAKRGDFAAGNGPWPAGNACLLGTSAETLS